MAERDEFTVEDVEALREALDAGWHMMVGHVGEHGYRALFYRGSLFEAGPKVDATHAYMENAIRIAALRALSTHVGDEG